VALLVVRALLEAYVVVIFARVILGWFPAHPAGALGRLEAVLVALTEPVLAPIRRVLPPIGVGGVGLDLSPVIVLVVLQILAARL
jgi:YggT family protein